MTRSRDRARRDDAHSSSTGPTRRAVWTARAPRVTLGLVATSRIRAERFGAMVAWDRPPALIAVDRALARQLGVSGGPLWEEDDPGLDVDALTAPNEVHLAVTDRCPAGCKGCYADAQPKGHHPTTGELVTRLRALAAQGVFHVAFGGGEALLRDDLAELARAAREAGLTPTMTTSGLGLTPDRARELAGFEQVNVSYDGLGKTYAAVRGYDGATRAERAMRTLRRAGVPFGVNVVLTSTSFSRLSETAARALSLGAREIQLLRFKPAGRGRLDYLAQRLTEAQIEQFPRVLRELSQRLDIAVRVDCALVPFLGPVSADDLVRFGVMGCEAGRSLLAVKADGRSSPCSFWEAGGTPVSRAWDHDPTVARFRRHGREPGEPCASCPVRRACRGGCRIVASFIDGEPFGPDPECPRVRAHRRAKFAEATPDRDPPASDG